VILVETSSRVEPLMPEIRKTGILFTQTVMGPTGEAAVVGFNDSVDKLQDFTTNAETIESTIANLGPGTSSLKLYDAMAAGVEMLSDRPQATREKPGRPRGRRLDGRGRMDCAARSRRGRGQSPRSGGCGDRRREPVHVQRPLH